MGRECERNEAVDVARELLAGPTKKIGDKALNTHQDWETIKNTMLDTARTDSFYRSQIERFYTEPMLKQWIERAKAGMKMRKGQLARWKMTLLVLETLRKERANETILGAQANGRFDSARMCPG